MHDNAATTFPRNSEAVDPAKSTGEGRCDDEEGGRTSAENKPCSEESLGYDRDASHAVSNDTECSPSECSTNATRIVCGG